MQVRLLSGAPHDELNVDVLVHNESDIKVRFKYTRSRVVGINGMVIKQCIKYYRDSSERRDFYLDVVQFGRMRDLGSRCRRFKSCHPDQGESVNGKPTVSKTVTESSNLSSPAIWVGGEKQGRSV